MDPAEGIETIRQMTPVSFPGTVIISSKEQALEEANTSRRGQVIWSDGSRLEDGRIGSAAVCRSTSGIWTAKKSALSDKKEVFNAELWGIHLALQLTNKSYERYKEITVFSDSQKAIQRTEHQSNTPGQMITSLIHERTRSLRALGYNTTIRWVPAHSGVLGNKQADYAANEAARISSVKEK